MGGLILSAARVAGRAWRAAGGWLGYVYQPAALPPAERDKQPTRLGRVGRDLRKRSATVGRELLVRGWVSNTVHPWMWGAGGAAAGLPAAGAPGAAIGASALIATALTGKLICGLRPRVNILSDVSSRVKTQLLARRLRRGWAPQMHRLGLAQQRTSRSLRDRLTRRPGRASTLVPSLRHLQLDRWGVTAEVDLHPLGLIVEDLATHRKRLQSVFLAQCEIRQRGYATAIVEFRHTDPLSVPIPTGSLPPPRRALHVVTRIAADGSPIEQDVILPRLVIGGQGSGKSTELTTYLWALHQAGIPVRLRVFDPKGGMELGWLRDAAHVYESRPHQWGRFIGEAVAAMQYRQRSLADRGWQKLTRFTDGEPLDILVVDELLAVVQQRRATAKIGRSGPEMPAGDAFDLYLSQARAAGYTAVALSQLGQKELLGHARGLFPHITVLRLPPTEKEIVERLLGPDHPAHLIPPGQPGVGYTRTPEGRIVRSRGAQITSSQQAELVAALVEAKQRREAAKQQRRNTAGVAA